MCFLMILCRNFVHKNGRPGSSRNLCTTDIALFSHSNTYDIYIAHILKREHSNVFWLTRAMVFKPMPIKVYSFPQGLPGNVVRWSMFPRKSHMKIKLRHTLGRTTARRVTANELAANWLIEVAVQQLSLPWVGRTSTLLFFPYIYTHICKYI